MLRCASEQDAQGVKAFNDVDEALKELQKCIWNSEITSNVFSQVLETKNNNVFVKIVFVIKGGHGTHNNLVEKRKIRFVLLMLVGYPDIPFTKQMSTKNIYALFSRYFAVKIGSQNCTLV